MERQCYSYMDLNIVLISKLALLRIKLAFSTLNT